MNRKQRRAAHSNLQEVARRHRRLVALNPDDAKAHNELACVLLEQGEPREAAAHFARAVALAPESLEQYPSVVATLLNVNPAIRAGVSRVASAWPRQLPAHDVLGPEGLASISNDPLLLCMLETATVRDLKLERYLIAVRQLIVDMASAPSHGDNVDENVLKLCCAVAKQCFINEYVFATTSEETEKAARLREALIEALASRLTIAPLVLVAAAAYLPALSFAAGAIARRAALAGCRAKPACPASHRARGGIEASRNDTAPYTYRERGLVAGPAAIRGESISALGWPTWRPSVQPASATTCDNNFLPRRFASPMTSGGRRFSSPAAEPVSNR